MTGRNKAAVWVGAAVGLLIWADPALGYAGPVPGPEFFGYFLSLVIWVGVTLFAVLAWPARVLLRRLRYGRPPAEDIPTPPESVPVTSGSGGVAGTPAPLADAPAPGPVPGSPTASG